MPIDRRTLLAAAGAAAVPLRLGAQAAPPSAAEVAAREKAAPPLPAIGTALAVPAVDLLDGTRFEPEQVRGRVLVLYWWASWCPFCALVTPHVAKLWHAQRSRGLAMLTLSIDRKADDARAYLRKHGHDFPTALVTPEFHKALPKPKGLPITIVLGRDGRVVQAESGQLFPEDVEALARHLG
ncbi:TlpA family protein disulfide reductase [Azohydromonas sediminis]|uniref:TlpA family protein disulfide reductase n=1 Tax=Azohydromonas sediminis TaxID=2259674 RepID=UPI000E649AD2|nr:TlpA disulfide reductase family protein [Azohydromonas sediminis]